MGVICIHVKFALQGSYKEVPSYAAVVCLQVHLLRRESRPPDRVEPDYVARGDAAEGARDFLHLEWLTRRQASLGVSEQIPVLYFETFDSSLEPRRHLLLLRLSSLSRHVDIDAHDHICLLIP